MVDYSQEELLAKWEEFFEEQEYHSRILSLADEYPETRSLEVRFEDLDRYDTDFGIYLLRRPQTAIAAGEETIRRLIPPTDEAVRVHLRMKGLPRESRVQIRDLRSKHLGTYIAVEGLVRKATEVRPKLTDASFRCARCGTVIKMPQENTVLHEPLECYEDQGGCKRSASATKFALMNEGSVFLDTQQIEAQEAPEGLRGGEEPRRLSAHIDDDMVGFAMPGDRVVLNGILRSYQRVKPGLKSTLFDIFMEINSMEMEQVEYEEIKISDEDVEEIRREAEDPDIFRHIVASIAPSIYGLDMEKEALSLQLFGGVPKHMPDGRRIRGDIHILLVGDPGTAKSELLAYMAKLSPRGILATGRAASAAGLTAAAIRSEEFGEGRWTLEAGALVLADKGLACIDEMDKMNPQDRSAIHEAMEQQRVSVAKAGITAVLQARCAVLGAANPKFGRFDEHKYVSEQIDMPPTLLSRFDIIFSMFDRPQAEYDRNLAEHIIRGHLAGEMITKREHGESVPASGVSDDAFRPFFKPDFFRKYVAFAKRIYPILSPEAMDTLKEQYLDIRKGGEMEGSAVPITPRQLEAYVRLAEASARARLSPIVSADDAARAVRIVEYWLSRVSGEGGRVDIDIITTGVSHSQREQMIVLRDILRELAGEDGTADLEDIVQLAEQRGIPVAQAEKILKRWKEEGEVYTPTEGKFRVVTRL
jgi:replicative DNA helicase Mcm